ncbi:hypothetical protein D3C71_18930 [compost metagenome]
MQPHKKFRFLLGLAGLAGLMLAGCAAAQADIHPLPPPHFDPGANAAGAYGLLASCGRGGRCSSTEQDIESRRPVHIRRLDAREFLARQSPPGLLPWRELTKNDTPKTYLVARYEGKAFQPRISDVFEPRIVSWLQRMGKDRLDVTCVMKAGAPSAMRYVLYGGTGKPLTAVASRPCSLRQHTTVLGLNLDGHAKPVLARLALVFTKGAMQLEEFQPILEAARKIPKAEWTELTRPSESP